ncbi:YceI family protein [Peredibacter sp. HCB2-198]|uniref:YceI family protein n=1 Tax=Peredibacter sp. HCB2-198 TaxID=3383025 RepID=UPI0038B47373
MKQLILTALFSLFLMNGAMARTNYTAGTYKIDSESSKVGLEVTHLTIPTAHGSFTHIDGIIDLKENFEDSKVYVLIDFLDSERNSQIEFVSTHISGTLANFNLTGLLSIQGVTQKVTFKSHYLGVVADGYGNDKAAFIGQTKIKDGDEEVKIDLRILANRPNKETASVFNEVQEIIK